MQRLFLYFNLAFILGIFLGSFLNLSKIVTFSFLIFIFGLILLNLKNKNLIFKSLILAAVFLGMLRFSFVSKPLSLDISNLVNSGQIKFVGQIIEEPKAGERSQDLVIEVKNIENLNKKLSGKILVKTRLYPKYNYGDLLEVNGKIQKPENFDNGFDYINFLAKDGIFSISNYPSIKNLNFTPTSKILVWEQIQKILFKIKSAFLENLNKILPEPQSTFAAGLLIGSRNANFNQQLKEDFNKSGTSHLIALSGYNITVVASFLSNFLNLLAVPFLISFWVSLLGILVFVFMAGAQASLIRAAIMGILVLVARRASRVYSAINALLIAAIFMLLINPKILRSDLSFQLSFAATLGLIFIVPFLEKKLKRVPQFLNLRRSLSDTLSAQIAVLPLILSSFGRLSVTAPLSNILVLPFIPLTMFFGFLSGILSFIFMPLAKFIGFISWLFLTYELKIIHFFASLKFSSINFGPIKLFLLIYIPLIIFIFKKWKSLRRI